MSSGPRSGFFDLTFASVSQVAQERVRRATDRRRSGDRTRARARRTRASRVHRPRAKSAGARLRVGASPPRRRQPRDFAPAPEAANEARATRAARSRRVACTREIQQGARRRAFVFVTTRFLERFRAAYLRVRDRFSKSELSATKRSLNAISNDSDALRQRPPRIALPASANASTEFFRVSLVRRSFQRTLELGERRPRRIQVIEGRPHRATLGRRAHANLRQSRHRANGNDGLGRAVVA